MDWRVVHSFIHSSRGRRRVVVEVERSSSRSSMTRAGGTRDARARRDATRRDATTRAFVGGGGSRNVSLARARAIDGASASSSPSSSPSSNERTNARANARANARTHSCMHACMHPSPSVPRLRRRGWISRDERRETSTCDVVSRLSRARDASERREVSISESRERGRGRRTATRRRDVDSIRFDS